MFLEQPFYKQYHSDLLTVAGPDGLPCSCMNPGNITFLQNQPFILHNVPDCFNVVEIQCLI
jgi:hypothetical protein